MSELAMTVIAGPSHPNTGELSAVHVFGGLYIGGSGTWRFGRVENNNSPPTGIEAVFLTSERLLIPEIRAGVALSLGLGDARMIVEEAAGSNWRDHRLELPPDVLVRIGDQSRHMSVGLLISTLDEALARDIEPHLNDEGWSVMLCEPRSEHRETQWDR
jgi:hypothetical protein